MFAYEAFPFFRFEAPVYGGEEITASAVMTVGLLLGVTHFLPMGLAFLFLIKERRYCASVLTDGLDQFLLMNVL